MSNKQLKKTYKPRSGGSRVVKPKSPDKRADKKGGSDNAG